MNRSAVVVSTIPLNCVEAFLVTLTYPSFRKLSVVDWCEMVKLVGILGDGGGGGARACLARRQIPLETEADLTMVIIKLLLNCSEHNKNKHHKSFKNRLFTSPSKTEPLDHNQLEHQG